MTTITLTQLLNNIQSKLKNNWCDLDNTKYIFHDLLNESINKINMDNLRDELYAYQEEIIHHKLAIEFLAEHDHTLHNCMEIADGYGYSPGDLNSVLLASILKTNFIQEEQNSNIEVIMESINEHINNLSRVS